MNETLEPEGVNDRSRRKPRLRKIALASATAVVGAGVLLGANGLVGIGNASTAKPTPPDVTTPAKDLPKPPPPGDRPPMPPGSAGMLSMIEHGMFVVATKGGDLHEILLVQQGTVTEVSATALTVKSEDGFTETYAIDSDTMVHIGKQGDITDLETGASVNVTALDGPTPTARQIDSTSLMPKPPNLPEA